MDFKLKDPNDKGFIYDFFHSIYSLFKNFKQSKENSLEKKTKEEVHLPGIHDNIQRAKEGVVDLKIVGDKKEFIENFEKYHGKKHDYEVEGSYLKYWNRQDNKAYSKTNFECKDAFQDIN